MDTEPIGPLLVPLILLDEGAVVSVERLHFVKKYQDMQWEFLIMLSGIEVPEISEEAMCEHLQQLVNLKEQSIKPIYVKLVIG